MAKIEHVKNKKHEIIHPITEVVAVEGLQEALAEKQETLVSGENIRKINGESILGSGEIKITGSDPGSTIIIDGEMSAESENPVQNKVITQALASKQDELESGVNIKTVNGKSIVGGGDLFIQEGDPSAVKFAPQELTEAQKAQARANINAASLEDINNMDFVTAASLPTASESTVGHIYLIGPDVNNNYDRYFTQESGGAYSWVSLGSTQIDLSDYAMETEVSQLRHEVDDISDELGMSEIYAPVQYSVVNNLRIANSPKGKMSAMTAASYIVAYAEFTEETEIRIVHNFGETNTAIGLYGYVDSVEDIVAGNTVQNVGGVAYISAQNLTDYYTVPAGKVFVVGSNTITATKLEIAVPRMASTKMDGIVKGWIIGECFTVNSATYTDGLIDSPVSVVWPDGNTGTLTITRNGDGLAVQVVASVGADTYTLTITRDTDGNVTSSNIARTN